METVYSWVVIRSGATMTITHSCGKLTGIVTVEPQWVDDGTGTRSIVATRADDKQFILG